MNTTEVDRFRASLLLHICARVCQFGCRCFEVLDLVASAAAASLSCMFTVVDEVSGPSWAVHGMTVGDDAGCWL